MKHLPTILLISSLLFVYITRINKLAFADSFLVFSLAAMWGFYNWLQTRKVIPIVKTEKTKKLDEEITELYKEKELLRMRLELQNLNRQAGQNEGAKDPIFRF